MTEEYTNYDDMLQAAAAAMEHWEAEQREGSADPVRHYLDGLPSLTARHEAAGAIRAIGAVLTGCREGALSVDWGGLRAAGVTAIKRLLLDKYEDRELTNRYLTTLQGVLRTAESLGLISQSELEAALEAVGASPAEGPTR